MGRYTRLRHKDRLNLLTRLQPPFDAPHQRHGEQSGKSTAVGLVSVPILVVTVIVVSTLLSRTHHFVVTDRAFTVLDASSPWIPTFPIRLRQRHPRNFYFGQLSGRWGMFELGNTKYWVGKQFHKDVAAADAALTAMLQRGEPGLTAAAPLGQQPRSLPPAGWYPNPTGGSDKRYWDGEQWAPAQQERFR
jgi:Protein of unknown function (DUF2510)